MLILIVLFLWAWIQGKSQLITNYSVKEENPDTSKIDTLFFGDIYHFFELPTERSLSLEFEPGWTKFFLPRILSGEHYLSGVREINPTYSLWEEKGILTLSDYFYLNLDHALYYSREKMDKIFFLSGEKSVFFYKYISKGENPEMLYFALWVAKKNNTWHVDATEIKDHSVELSNNKVIFPHKIQP